jgi:hypothetical protein
MPGVELKLDHARIHELLVGTDGPVFRHMIERVTRFQDAARRQQPRRTGCLQDSTVKRFEVANGELQIRVISDTTSCSPTRTSYSLFVHEGTEAHVIQAIFSVLAFMWANGPNGPGMYYFTWVFHPGTQPNRFFTDNLHILVDPI